MDLLRDLCVHTASWCIMHLSIITPEHTVYDGEIDQVTLQTAGGEITVLPHHVPYVAELRPGELRIVCNGKEEPMACAGGFIEVLPGNRVAILADDVVRVREMDVAAIEAAQERAQMVLEGARDADEASFAAAAATLERELAKVRVARKYRHHSLHAPNA